MDRIVSFYAIVIFASSCAKVGVPTGGEKDSNGRQRETKRAPSGRQGRAERNQSEG